MARYWVYIDSKMQGPVDVPSLRKLTGFNLLAQVCEEGEKNWRLADEVIEIKSYFLSPPRISSLPLPIGNTVVIPAGQPEPVVASSPLSVLRDDDTLVEELPPLKKVDKPPVLAEKPEKSEEPKKAARAGGLRALCDVCGYKNPRDVRSCMKCGTAISGAGSTEVLEDADESSPVKKAGTNVDDVLATLAAPEPAAEPLLVSTMEKVPMTIPRWVWIALPVTLIVIGSIFGVRHFKKQKAAKAAHAAAQVAAQKAAAEAATQKTVETPKKARVYPHYSANTENLPGLTPRENTRQVPDSQTPSTERASVSDQNDNPGYRVIAEATPLKHRTSSPVDSVYATKRRADKSLWTAQQEQAMRQVQRTRIYGGQRTIQRNAEILMQILRDREYSAAFETGKRPYYYNDMDWAATLKEGPIYDVRLTFSGGREDDGSPRNPLRFSFLADLERRSTEPSGDEDSVRTNTLHAFFDESRIPPEERRPIARDVEELVMAADPNASPLALDTVVRAFANTYTLAALERVANAFNLELVKRKLKHDPSITSSGKGTTPVSSKAAEPSILSQLDRPQSSKTNVSPTPGSTVIPSAVGPTPTESRVPARSAARMSSDNSLDFKMEKGNGRDQTILARATSKASADRLWETLTGYERFKLFIPDVLVSEREGQDGNAVIVRTVSLSRWMMFVFKVTLHLRLIERPSQHIIEFERIAGDFETFRGSFEVVTDPVSKQSAILFRAAIVPKGRMPSWVLRDMSKRFILPKLDAIRTRAETN